MSKIHTIIEGGVVHDVLNIPPGVAVEIIDYDVEGVEADRIEKSPFGGEPCVISHHVGGQELPDPCTLHRLLLRAHDLMFGEHSSETFADCSDLVGDIRAALNLPVTDCEYCSACVAKAEAVELDGHTLCPGCAETEQNLGWFIWKT